MSRSSKSESGRKRRLIEPKRNDRWKRRRQSNMCERVMNLAGGEQSKEPSSGFSIGLFPCLYYGLYNDSDIDGELDVLIDFLLDSPSPDSPAFESDFRVPIHLLYCVMKGKSFEQECEWWLIIQADDRNDCVGACVIGDKARIPACFSCGDGVGKMIQELVLSPHGERRRLCQGTELAKLTNERLKYNDSASNLSFNRR